MHYINIHVGWDSGSYHQGGRIVRRYSSDGGSTWSAWEQVIENRNPYSNGARTDVDFGSYVYTTNAATYSYQGEQVQFNFLDRQIVSVIKIPETNKKRLLSGKAKVHKIPPPKKNDASRDLLLDAAMLPTQWHHC